MIFKLWSYALSVSLSFSLPPPPPGEITVASASKAQQMFYFTAKVGYPFFTVSGTLLCTNYRVCFVPDPTSPKKKASVSHMTCWHREICLAYLHVIYMYDVNVAWLTTFTGKLCGRVFLVVDYYLSSVPVYLIDRWTYFAWFCCSTDSGCT